VVLKTIFFDMGGTIDTFRYTREYRVKNVPILRECLNRSGITLSATDEQLTDMIAQGAAGYLKWNMVTNIELKPAEIWSRYYLKEAGISVDALEPIAEELAFLYETRLYIRQMRPEMPDVLAAIKEMGLKIGCISNTQGLKQVPHNLQEYGIFDYFDPIVLSSSYGRRKPDPAIFYYAARLAGVPTSACIYIGDKINRDVLGAKRAGFRAAIQIKHDYDNGELDEGAVPDAVIQNMQELIPLLEAAIQQDKNHPNPRSEKKVKAIFFDAGDILYHRPERGKHLNRFLKKQKLQPCPNFETEKKRLRDMAFSGQIRRHTYYEQVLKLYGITSAEDLVEGITAMHQDDITVEIIAGASETVKQLKDEGFILGIITDTAMPFSKKLDWFDKHGFGRLWDSVISSREIGTCKPSPTMYQLALEQTGVTPGEAVFVGHKGSELDGARAMGLRTIGLHCDPEALADIYIQDIRDLLRVPLLQE
jgi:putative hydrolase of the HAD superfamily